MPKSKTVTEVKKTMTQEAPVQTPPDYLPPKQPRKYTGPPKGSDEANDRMAKVRAAQWAKNGLVVSKS